MADSPNSNTAVTTEAIAQASVEVIELAGLIHGLQTGQVGAVEYTPEVGRVVLDTINSIDVNGQGVMMPDLLQERRAEIFAQTVESQTQGGIPADYVANLVEQAEVNIKVLDSVYEQGVRIVPTEDGVSLSQDGQEIATYTIDEINAQRAAVASGEAAPTTVITRTEPAEAIPADVQERVMRIEQALAKIIPAVNQAFPDANIPNVGNIDGVLDQKSYDALDAAIGGVTNVLNTSDNFVLSNMRRVGTIQTLDYDGQFSEDFCEKLQKNLGIAMPLMGAQIDDPALKAQLTSVSIPSLISDIEYLRDHDSLKPVEMVEVEVSVDSGVEQDQAADVSVDEPQVDAGPGVSGGTSGADTSSDADNAQRAVGDINEAVTSVETMMSLISSKIDDFDLGPMGDKISSFKDQLIKPINQGDFDENGQAIFDENSQEMASTLLMVLKTVGGYENPNGEYNQNIGNQLQIDILSKDEFAFIRAELGINGKYELNEARALVQGIEDPGAFEEIEGESQADRDARFVQHSRDQETFEAFNQLKRNNEEGLRQLNQMFSGLDKLSDPEIDMLDPNNRAAGKTRNNLMLDIAGGFLEKTGMLNGIKDFFQNNAIGQFIGTILGMVGFDVNRLWGETGEDLENPQQMASKLGDDFERVYQDVQSENPDASFDEVMRLTKEQTMDGMNGFWGGNALKLALGSDNKEMLTAAVGEAMDAASQAGNLQDAKNIFVERIEEFGEAYKNGQTIELGGREYSKTDNGLGNDVANLDQTLNQMGQQWIAGMDATMVAGFDDDAIKLNDSQALDTVINYDTDAKDQGVNRFGDVEPIQKYLYENAEALGLDEENIAKFAVEGEDGSVEFTKTLDIETCAAIEEMWVKAKLHDAVTSAQEQGTEITAEMIDGWVSDIDAEKLAKGPGADGGIHPDFAADLELMKQYAEANGALEGFQAIADNEIIEAEEALVSMDTDMQAADGEVQTFSVLEQSLTWNQVDITKLALEVQQQLDQPATEQPVTDAPVVAPIPDDAGSCETTCQDALTREPDLPSVLDLRGDFDLNPRNYRDLPVFGLNTEEAEHLRNILVEKDPSLGERAREYGQDPIERFAMEMKQSGGNEYLLMDLNEMGENVHPNFDGVMIHLGRGFDSVPEIRYYDYDRHGINSLEEHRLNADQRFKSDNPLSPMDKDFDTFFSILDRQGTSLELSPSSGSGFKGMAVVTEDLTLKNGYAAVYGDAAFAQEMSSNQYTASYSNRETIYQTAENEDYMRELQNKIKLADRSYETGPTAQGQPRISEFNSISGAEQGDMVASVDVDVEVQQAISDIGGDQFDPSIEAGYVPGMGNTNTASVSVRTA